MTDWKEIVQKVQNGDQEAFTRLYAETKDACLRVIGRYCDITADYDDLLQETYIQVYKHISDLKDAQKTQAWINKIAANTAIRHNMKKRPMMFSELADEEGNIPDIADDNEAVDPAKIADKRAITDVINEVLQSLPVDQRDALWMVYGQRITIREMAANLAISENTIKSRLFQGRQKLLARRGDFERMGISLSAIPVSVLIFVAFNEDVYAGEFYSWQGVADTAEAAAPTPDASAASSAASAPTALSVPPISTARASVSVAPVTSTARAASSLSAATASHAASTVSAATAAQASTAATAPAGFAGLGMAAKAAIIGGAALVAVGGGGAYVAHQWHENAAIETVTYPEETTVHEAGSLTELSDLRDAVEEAVADLALPEEEVKQPEYYYQAYKDYLMNTSTEVLDPNMNSNFDRLRYSFDDLDGDGIPELFYAFGNFTASGAYICTYDEGRVNPLGYFGTNGAFEYYPGIGLVMESMARMGIIWQSLSELETEGFMNVCSYSIGAEDDPGNQDWEECYIYGQSASYEDVAALMEERTAGRASRVFSYDDTAYSFADLFEEESLPQTQHSDIGDKDHQTVESVGGQRNPAGFYYLDGEYVSPEELDSSMEYYRRLNLIDETEYSGSGYSFTRSRHGHAELADIRPGEPVRYQVEYKGSIEESGVFLYDGADTITLTVDDTGEELRYIRLEDQE